MATDRQTDRHGAAEGTRVLQADPHEVGRERQELYQTFETPKLTFQRHASPNEASKTTPPNPSQVVTFPDDQETKYMSLWVHSYSNHHTARGYCSVDGAEEV